MFEHSVLIMPSSSYSHRLVAVLLSLLLWSVKNRNMLYVENFKRDFLKKKIEKVDCRVHAMHIAA